MAKSPGRSPAHQLVLARRATVPVPRLTNWSDSRGNRPRSRPPTPTRKIAQVPRTAVPAHQLVSIHFPGPQTWGPSRLSSRQLVSLTGPAGRPRPRTPTPHDHFLFHHPGRPHTHANWSDTERPAVPPSQCPPTGLTHRAPAGHPRPFPVPTNWSPTTGRPSPAPDPDANGQSPPDGSPAHQLVSHTWAAVPPASGTVPLPTNWSHSPLPGPDRPANWSDTGRPAVPAVPKSLILVANWSSSTVARPVPGRFPPQIPTNWSYFPWSHGPAGRQKVANWSRSGRKLPVQNFFFRPAAGRPGLANWSGVCGCGWWVARRFWVVFPENGGRPPGKILPTPVPRLTNWSHDPDPKRTGAGLVRLRKGPSKHPLHKLSPGELYDGGVKKPDVAGLASRDRNN